MSETGRQAGMVPSPHDARSVPELIAAMAGGQRAKFVFFWGHKGTAGGALGPHVFSQWYAAPFEVDGVGYPTAEHYMMAEKARLFGDRSALDKILATPNPGAAKHLGRTVRDFEEAAWGRHRFDIAVRGNEAKFSSRPELAGYLAATGQRVLVEASPVDRIWGIGLAKDAPEVENPGSWRGLNLLGFALMEARDRIGGG